MLLIMGAGACGRREESRELTALDNAYNAGVITKNEYEAKKAVLVNRAASLAALDKARDAGLLTPAEYGEHKAKLISNPPAPPAAPAPDASASGTAAAPIPQAPPTAAAVTGVRKENIFDPTLQMNAYTVSVPSTWKFDGVYVAGSSCAALPFPVFRAYSPDGLTEVRRFRAWTGVGPPASSKAPRIPTVWI